MMLKELLEPSPGKMVRDLLEDFEIVGTINEIVLKKRYQSWPTFTENIYAAIVASTLRLSSIDYARSQYCKRILDDEDEPDSSLSLKYVNAYKSAKDYMEKLIDRLSPEGKDEPSYGIFGASLVLERLQSTLFGAHLMYSLGNRYEGHAVSRLMLEQIAWAYEAFTLDDLDKVKKIVTTKAISKLTKFIPWCGRLYGFLSQKTHIDYENHIEFLRTENGKNVILHGQAAHYEYAQVILCLADLFGIVWEMSQFHYLKETEAVQFRKGIYSARENRPFRKTIEHHLLDIEKTANKNIQPDAE
ncbi:MAG: hypothetical protein HZA11_06725 [Nitrospirae bacterium]|nr:hypothetical protein [Nitrospirota bacterium]